MKIGIDLGGSHIAVGIVEDGKLRYKVEEDLNKESNLLEKMKELITRTLIENQGTREEIEKVGIACPGTISNGNIIKAGNLKLYHFPLVEELKKEFANTEITLRNDGKCAALAEKYYGSLKKAKDCIFINIGTGIGGAVFLEGKLLEPKKYSGFEIGHMVIEKGGRQCTCGKKGCFETYGSIRALKQEVKKELHIEKDITGKELLNIMLEENENLDKVMQEYIENLAIGIGNLIDIFEPEIISIGGSFSYYDELLIPKLTTKIQEKNMTFNEENLPEIVTAELQNDAGILGAIL